MLSKHSLQCKESSFNNLHSLGIYQPFKIFNAKLICFTSQRKFATPLLLAASGGHKAVVEVLISHGASASDEDAVSIGSLSLCQLKARHLNVK